jgi:hypothetical protein
MKITDYQKTTTLVYTKCLLAGWVLLGSYPGSLTDSEIKKLHPNADGAVYNTHGITFSWKIGRP